MSVAIAGIDIGDAASCIALARKGGERLGDTWPAADHRPRAQAWRPAAALPAGSTREGDAGSLALPAGVDVLLNKESNRETPSVVTFTSKQRMLGTDAGACLGRPGRHEVPSWMCAV